MESIDYTLDKRSTDLLIETALKTPDDDEYTAAICPLKWRGTREVMEKAKKLCESDALEEQLTGVDIVSELGMPERSFPDECCDILLSTLDEAEEPELLALLGYAFDHLRHPKCIPALSKLKNHADPQVRLGVVHGLIGHDDELANAVLLELMRDSDEEVRNWATFSIGKQIEADRPEIRDALFARIGDSNEEVHFEALMGLAMRKDERVLPLLRKEFENPDLSSRVFEVAEELKSPEIFPLLNQIDKSEIENPDFLRRLKYALEACSPEQKQST